MQKGFVFLRVTGKIAVVYASSLLAMLIAGQYDPEHVLLSLIHDSLLPVTPFALILWHNQWRKETWHTHPHKKQPAGTPDR